MALCIWSSFIIISFKCFIAFSGFGYLLINSCIKIYIAVLIIAPISAPLNPSDNSAIFSSFTSEDNGMSLVCIDKISSLAFYLVMGYIVIYLFFQV